MLAVRSTADELMDAGDLAPEIYAAVMHDLARVNTLTMARRPTLAFLERVVRAVAVRQFSAARAAAAPGSKVHIGPVKLKLLDVGFGDGDMLRAIHRWAKRRRVEINLVGIDLNPRSAPAARAATPSDIRVDWRTGDYTDLAGQEWDVIISSLVAHHMTSDQLVAFLRFMQAQANKGWFVNDLHRHGFAYRGYPLLARLMRWHPIVRHDGQLSIARSYRPHEWPPILHDANITNARVFRAFPFRLCVETIC